MNQPTEIFLIQLRDLCRLHGVDFSADLNGVYFADESPIGIEADVQNLEDLEYQLATAREKRIRQAIAVARGKHDPNPST